ncbi:MAG: flagellar assembly protein FliW, partial [Opitutales bacterium]
EPSQQVKVDTRQDILPESSDPADTPPDQENEVILKNGLFGFPDVLSMEIVFSKEELPFMWIQEKDKQGIRFIVIEPTGDIIPNYLVEISDADVKSLGITGIDDTMILNIVTLNPEHPGKISVNLVGPIVINRKTRVGRQCILNNHEDHSARYVINVGEPDETTEAEPTAC